MSIKTHEAMLDMLVHFKERHPKITEFTELREGTKKLVRSFKGKRDKNGVRIE